MRGVPRSRRAGDSSEAKLMNRVFSRMQVAVLAIAAQTGFGVNAVQSTHSRLCANPQRPDVFQSNRDWTSVSHCG
jgi:hypothetical protein